MMCRSLACTLLALGMLLSATAYSSGVDTYEFRHPERQTRAQDLARALRCPQCQNQNPVSYTHLTLPTNI